MAYEMVRNSCLYGTWKMPQEANLESLQLRSGFVVWKLVKSLEHKYNGT